ncbi:DNA-binding helix-turn-helix protein [Leptospira ellinghausenii]|uniref:XRE family transcriptional regulator n=2 Tax=Leptospira TaxID=171 RepID=A0ABY2L9R1_9LEPT|nr:MULTISPECIES: helix-turn-helix transcriptional regulator [Leptospira]TGK54248.1 XRE family transcriptional regulator [Leptospira bouyouniensis]GBF44444.1 DNA-binding helix-turn-helix protein [Leptospira ellinghausenii]
MDFKSFADQVAKNIKKIRTEKGMSQEEVSGLEMGVRTYQRIENGINPPNLESIFKIAKSLGVQPRDLLDIPSNSPKTKKN